MTNKSKLPLIFIVALTFLFISLLSGCSIVPDKSEVSLIVECENVPKEVPFGTELNLSGLVVRVKLADGTFRTLPRGGEKGYSVNDGGYRRETPGEYTIKISYNTYTPVAFVIKVLEEEIIDENQNKDVTLIGIAVKSNVGKRLFFVDEPFSTQDIIVERVFSNGTREPVAEPQYEVDYSKFDPREAGEYTITIKYYPNYNMMATYTVVVIEPSQPTLFDITIKTQNVKTEYLYGDSFTAQGIIVEKHFDNDGIIETIVAEFSELVIDTSAFDETVLGSQIITVTIENTNISSTYNVTVIDYIESINTAHKVNYDIGDDFDFDSISVFVTMASGHAYQGDMDDFTVDITEFDSQEEGSYQIIVYLTDDPEIHTAFLVNVNQPII